MDESDELSGLEGMLALTWVSLAVISYIKIVQENFTKITRPITYT